VTQNQTNASRAGLVTLAMPAIVVVVTLAVSVLAIAVAVGSDDTTAVAVVGEPLVVDVELGDLFVRPSSVDVPAGTELVLRVTNAGAVAHDLKLEGGDVGTAMLDPGASAEVSLGAFEASAEAWCTVPGHKEAGMVLAINVTGAAPDGAADGGQEPVSEGATIDFAAEPGPDFLPYDPALQPAPGGTEHAVTLRATEKVIEVAPGVTQELWTFNDQVPGPILRGRVGDVFTVTLVNEGTLGHSIDFHASKVAWNDEMRTIDPGESLVYQFQAKHAGIFMYHCGTAPALHHIGNGMFGALIVDPPNLPPVDREYVFVQSELYLGDQGAPGDLAKMQDEAFDAVVFNGYVNQYLHRPIRVEPGERIRTWVLDAGPSENSAFHIVGTIFDTIFKEGTHLLQPDSREGGAQVLDLQPAQGGFAEFTFDEAGLYPIVTHKFANVGKGALGLFQAGEVEPTTGGH
jgi:nitrite reductase (NO-forming)